MKRVNLIVTALVLTVLAVLAGVSRRSKLTRTIKHA